MEASDLIVVGAAGQVGSALLQLAPHARSVTRRDLDLTNPHSIAAFFSTPPRTPHPIIINVAAYTAVDAAEQPDNAETVWAVNADAPGHLASLGIPIIHVSTDYVFDGSLPVGQENSEEMPTNPINAYGRSKLAGEQAVLHHGGHVIRTSWVYSGPAHPGRDFVSTMADLAERGVNPRVVNDQWGRPSEASVVASAILDVAQRIVDGEDAPHLLHAAGAGPVTTWFEFARHIFAATGHDPNRVQPISTSDYPTPAARPANSALDIRAWEHASLPALPAWQDSLERALR